MVRSYRMAGFVLIKPPPFLLTVPSGVFVQSRGLD